MTEKRFNIVDLLETMAISDNDECKYYQNSNDDFKKLCDLLNEYEDKYAKSLWDYNGLGCEYEGLKEENVQLKEHIKSLEKQCVLLHMRSMFSTVKSFKGDVSKRYKYSEKTDTIYDTANHYGQYDKVLGKKEIVMLLNEYETVLRGLEE